MSLMLRRIWPPADAPDGPIPPTALSRDALDLWAEQVVHFYPVAASDACEAPPGDVLDPAPAAAPAQVTRDIRDFLPPGHLMDDVGLSRQHDGRHPLALGGMLRTFGTPGMLGMICSILDTLVELLRSRARPLCVRILCTHGRHRSVAAAVALAQVFRLVLGIAAVAYVNGSPDWRGRSRLCTAGRCCPACVTGPTLAPILRDLHPLLPALLERVRSRRQLADRARRPAAVQGFSAADLWCALECMID